MSFKAMRLDERDVMVAIDELDDETELSARHVDLRPFGGDCDRRPREYRWNREHQCLEPLPRHQRAVAAEPTLEMALAFDLLKRWEQDATRISDVSLQWLDAVVLSLDFTSLVLAKHELIWSYMIARGIEPKIKEL